METMDNNTISSTHQEKAKKMRKFKETRKSAKDGRSNKDKPAIDSQEIETENEV